MSSLRSSNQAAPSGISSSKEVASLLVDNAIVILSAAPLESLSMRRYQCDSPKFSLSLLNAKIAASGSVPSANHCSKTGSNCLWICARLESPDVSAFMCVIAPLGSRNPIADNRSTACSLVISNSPLALETAAKSGR